MSKELFDMYSQELEYVCKNLGSTCYIYCYDKTKMIDHKQGQLDEFLRLEVKNNEYNRKNYIRPPLVHVVGSRTWGTRKERQAAQCSLFG